MLLYGSCCRGVLTVAFPRGSRALRRRFGAEGRPLLEDGGSTANGRVCGCCGTASLSFWGVFCSDGAAAHGGIFLSVQQTSLHEDEVEDANPWFCYHLTHACVPIPVFASYFQRPALFQLWRAIFYVTVISYSCNFLLNLLDRALSAVSHVILYMHTLKRSLLTHELTSAGCFLFNMCSSCFRRKRIPCEEAIWLTWGGEKYLRQREEWFLILLWFLDSESRCSGLQVRAAERRDVVTWFFICCDSWILKVVVPDFVVPESCGSGLRGSWLRRCSDVVVQVSRCLYFVVQDVSPTSQIAYYTTFILCKWQGAA